MNIEQNNVPANKQVRESNYVGIIDNNADINVLFVGNSITRHEPKPEIGWENDWGMAATKKENDYVHLVVDYLQKKYGKINYCVANCGEWEINYYNDEIILGWQKAKEFCADIIIIRLGENINYAYEMFSEESVYEHYKKMVRFFINKNNAKVILTDLFWKKEEIDNAIRRVANECNYEIVNIGDLGDNTENMPIGKFANLGVAMHPNDNGMRGIADRIIEKLR